MLAAILPAFAQQEAEPLVAEKAASVELTPQENSNASVASADEDEPYKLHRALRERDISFGYGRKINIHRFYRREAVDVYQIMPRWGRFRNSTQEFLWEVPIAYYRPGSDSAYSAGLTLMLRQHLTSNRRFSPFIEAGSGFVITNLDDKIKEIGGHFQFSPQAGVGFRTAVSRSSDIVASLRWYHLSNAGTESPNTGLNNYLVTVGYSRLY